MAIISFAISIRNEADLPSGHKRKKAGDLIAVKPGLWQWGGMERKQYLIVDVSVPDAVLPKVKKLICPYYADGSFEDDAFGDPKEILGKRRFSIPASVIQTKYPAWFASVDWQRVQDPEDDYQPLRDNGRIIDLTSDRHQWFYDKVRDRLATQAEIDGDLS